MSKVSNEINVTDIINLLGRLKEAEKELSTQSQLVYKLLGSCDGEYTKAVDGVTEILYGVLEFIGFHSEVLYDWVREDEFLIYTEGFIYDCTDAESYTLFVLDMKGLSEFTPCGEYTENEDGTINKTMY